MMFESAFWIGWWRGAVAAVLLAASATHARAQVVDGGDSPWARAIDDYLAGSEASVAAILSLSPEDVTVQSREALDAWIATWRAPDQRHATHGASPSAVSRRQRCFRSRPLRRSLHDPCDCPRT